VADFVCLERRLIVEVDGTQHGEPRQQEHDAQRTQWLNMEGYRVLRIWANEVDADILAVLDRILVDVENSPLREERSPDTPTSPRQG
jgi:very-short-patch-repair endonuclease